jgi:hypothetical protein
MVCSAISSYSFGATALIFCMMFSHYKYKTKTNMDLCNQISFGDEYFPMETILLKKILFFQDYNDTAVTLS